MRFLHDGWFVLPGSRFWLHGCFYLMVGRASVPTQWQMPAAPRPEWQRVTSEKNRASSAPRARQNRAKSAKMSAKIYNMFNINMLKISKYIGKSCPAAAKKWEMTGKKWEISATEARNNRATNANKPRNCRQKYI
jgi:hypothetical protein